MGDEQKGDAGFALHGFQLGAHLFAEFGIEGGEGLVEEEQPGFEGDGAREGHPLFFAAGKLGGIAIVLGRQAGLIRGLEGLFDWLFAMRRSRSPIRRAEGGEVGEKGVVLEDGGDVALVGFESVDAGAVEENFAGSGLVEASDEAEGGGFTAAGGAEEGVETAGFEGERDLVDGALAGEIFDHVAEFEDRVHWVITYLTVPRASRNSRAGVHVLQITQMRSTLSTVALHNIRSMRRDASNESKMTCGTGPQLG